MLKTLFLYFGEYGVLYKHPTDFANDRGAYAALLDHKLNEIAKERVDFGSLPNRSAIDISSFDKIANAIKEGKIKPYTVNDDLIMLTNFLVGVHFMLRGCDKHGHKKLEIVNSQDKCMHVSVKHPVRLNNIGCFDAV